MSPVTHLLLSWSTASLITADRKDRSLITLAGVLPDLDGAGILWDLATRQPGEQLVLWARFHHILGHNLAFGLGLSMLAFFVASRRIVTATMVCLVFHLHLLCDLLGSKGPDEFWSIPYLLPFSQAWDFVWAQQWPLVSWQNISITILALTFVFYQTLRKGISPLELLSQRASNSVVETLRQRFGTPEVCRSPLKCSRRIG